MPFLVLLNFVQARQFPNYNVFRSKDIATAININDTWWRAKSVFYNPIASLGWTRGLVAMYLYSNRS